MATLDSRNTPSTGHQCELYVNLSGSFDNPLWVLVDEITAVNIADLARGLAEMKRRASDFTKNLPSIMQTISVEFQLIHGLENHPLFWDAFKDSFFNGTPLLWRITDGAQNNPPPTGPLYGLEAPFLIEQFPWNQPLEDVNQHDIRLAVAYAEYSNGTEIDPAWTVLET